jgi:hypothetical protein
VSKRMREANVCTFDTSGSKHRAVWRYKPTAHRLDLQFLMEQDPNSPKHVELDRWGRREGGRMELKSAGVLCKGGSPRMCEHT